MNSLTEATPVCESDFYQFKKHKCRFCPYRSVWSHTVKRHEKRKHSLLLELDKQGTVIQSTDPIPSSFNNEYDKDNISYQSESFNIQLENFFKIFICGPSKSGKTHFLTQLLSNLNTISEKPPPKVIYVFQFWQSKLEEMRSLNLVDIFLEGGDGLKTRLSKVVDNHESLIIFDDQMNNRESLQYISNLFTVEARHTKLSLIFVTQKLFFNDDSVRQIRENADYFVLFKNPKDVSSISYLSTRMTKNSTLADIYYQATQKPHSYLFIDVRQQSIPQTQYLSNLFGTEHIVTTYIIEMNPYKKPTKFDKMFLISEEKLNDLYKEIDDVNQLELQKEVEIQTPISNETSKNVFPPATKSESVKRKREYNDSDNDNDNEGEENEAQKPRLSLENSPPLPPDVDPESVDILPSESVIISTERKRDIGRGLDDDIQKSAEQENHLSQIEGDVNSSTQLSTAEAGQQEANDTLQSSSVFQNVCDICGKSLRTAQGLKVHKTVQHFSQRKKKEKSRNEAPIPPEASPSITNPTLVNSSSSKVENETPPLLTVNRKRKILDQDDIDELAIKKTKENIEGDHCICLICNKHFKSKRLFDKHVKQAHVNVEPERIENVLEMDSGYADRKRKNKKKAELNKEIINKKRSQNLFRTAKNKEKAAKSLLINKEVCNLCNKVFTSEKKLREHFISSHQM